MGYFLSRQFLRFLAVGMAAASLHWLARLLLSHWISFAWALVLAYGVGIFFAYLLNAVYVFPASTRPRALQIRDFVVVNVCFFPLVWSVAYLLNGLLISLGYVLYAKELAHAVAVVVPAAATFLIYKLYAFKEA